MEENRGGEMREKAALARGSVNSSVVSICIQARANEAQRSSSSINLFDP